MKAKYVVLGIAILLVTVGPYAGRTAWRIHRQLVTLDVRNLPLAVVLHNIERQTWKKIRTPSSLASTRVTLHVKDAPCDEVLNRLAEQVGARWSTLYAVYQSSHALKSLDSALRSGGEIEAAGWARIAPPMPTLDHEPDGGPGPRLSLNPNPDGAEPGSPGDDPPRDFVFNTNPGGAPPLPGRGRMMMVRRGPNGPVVFQGGPEGKVEIWSPEELLAESSLNPQLRDDPAIQNGPPTEDTAARAARMVHGAWTTYVAFRKSGMGIGFALPRPPQPGADPGLSMRGPNPNGRFSRLTPDQRVQRARERRQFNGRMPIE